MVCVRRDTGLHAGYLELHHDMGEIGGILAPDHRGQGLGAELFLAGVEFAHGHASLPTVRAGKATANLACLRALERADFVPAPGPARHTLPDGRELDSVGTGTRPPHRRARGIEGEVERRRSESPIPSAPRS
ncbi:acetyltransferase, GNAT family [Streptomyces turgidiscabies Car8]|uniref:Acetyltransferase, GNAT family n=1 Tax=Streptomyces turgidiscabies (strain Car8) TaxID=698760 RepID=L7ERV5_STRT8|nr:acetyltransferase, GNAT family [Streptomyces turgidiscabies Car8]